MEKKKEETLRREEKDIMNHTPIARFSIFCG